MRSERRDNPLDVFHQLNFEVPLVSQHITFGRALDMPGLIGLDIAVVTPEPATLLLWGTSGRDLGAETQTNRRQRSDSDLVTCFAAPSQPDSPPRTVGYGIRFGASALSIANLHDA